MSHRTDRRGSILVAESTRAVDRRSVVVTTRGISQPVESDTADEDEMPVRSGEPGNVVIKWMTTTDHKTIGTLYLVTSFA